tara:strand:- start:27 stop:308 length:282 start_codon:yes stop_codon:yes gene_type:complete
MKNQDIHDLILSVVKTINKDRPDEKIIIMKESTKLLGSESVLDSLDLFMFIVELESQLGSIGESINVMGIIETAINENKEITLKDLIADIQKL